MHYRSRISHRFQCKMLKSKFCHSYDMTRWKLPQSPNIAQRVAGIVKPQSPLKNRLDIAQSKMQGQISRLDLVHEDFKKKEKVLFNKVVQSQKRNDRAYAQAYATELHHLRKTSNMIGFVQSLQWSRYKCVLEQCQIWETLLLLLVHVWQ